MSDLRVVDKHGIVHAASLEWTSYNLGDVQDRWTACEVNTSMANMESRGTFETLGPLAQVTCLLCLGAVNERPG